MLIFHIIRDRANKCLFKDILQEVLHSGQGDSCYLSTGFISENKHLVSNNVSTNNDSFVSQTNTSNLDITIFGAYNFGNNLTPNSQTLNFQNFINHITPYFKSVNFKKKARHHAKAFIYEKNNVPIFEIIGSSNLTRRAYMTPVSDFNFEADLVISNDEDIDNKLKKLLKDENNIMYLDYSPENTKQLQEQMKWLRDKLLENLK